MRALILLLLLSIISTACVAARPPLTWTSDNPSANLAADRYVCAQESRVNWNAQGLLFVAAAQADAQRQSDKLYAMCMEARGWRLGPVPPAAYVEKPPTAPSPR